MRLKAIWIYALLGFSLLITGCWDYRDLEDQNIMILGALDLKEGQRGTMLDGVTLVGGAIIPNLNPNAKEKSRFDAVAGQTINQGREVRVGRSTGRYMVGQLQVILLGNNLARSGVDNWMNTYIRDPRVKHNLHLAVTTGRAVELAKFKTPNVSNTGEQIKSQLEQMPSNGFYPKYSMYDYVVDYITPGKNPVMPLLELRNNNKIVCVGCAVFKKDKMVAELGLTEMRTLILLRGQNSRGMIPYVIKEDGKTVDRGAIQATNSRKVSVTRKGDNFFFDIDITLKGRLMERARHESLFDNPEQLKAIEKAVNDEIRGDCYRLIDRMQKGWQADSIDVSRFALAKWRRELENQVDKDFISKAHFNVRVDTQILRFGEGT